MKKIILLILCTVSLNLPAANKYWGGTGNSNDANHWFTDSTFATTTTVPGATDNIYFTKAAGAVTCTVNAQLTCLSIDCHGWSGTITASSVQNLFFYGNAYLNGTWSTNIQMICCNASGTNTLSTNGRTMGPFRKYNGAGKIQFQDTYYSTSALYLDIGEVDFNSKTVTVSSISRPTSTNACTLTTGTASITITGTGIDFATNGSNFTFNGAGSIIHLISAGASTYLRGNGKTFNVVSFDGASGGGVISGSNTYDSLLVAPASAKTYQFTDGTSQATSYFSATGSPGNLVTLTGTSTGGWTLSQASGTVTVSFCKIIYSTATGGANFRGGSNSYNCGGNSGWKFQNSLLFGTDF